MKKSSFGKVLSLITLIAMLFSIIPVVPVSAGSSVSQLVDFGFSDIALYPDGYSILGTPTVVTTAEPGNFRTNASSGSTAKVYRANADGTLNTSGANGILKVSAVSAVSANNVTVYGGGSGTGSTYKITPITTDEITLEANVKLQSGMSDIQLYVPFANTAKASKSYIALMINPTDATAKPIKIYNGASWNYYDGVTTANVTSLYGQFATFKLVINFNTNAITFYLNGTPYSSSIVASKTVGAAIQALYAAKATAGFNLDYTGGTGLLFVRGVANSTVAIDFDYYKISEIITTPPAITSVGLNQTTLSLDATSFQTAQLTATAYPVEEDQRFNWTSSNSSVASVDTTGKVTALSAGTATITATSAVDATKYASCNVTTTTTYVAFANPVNCTSLPTSSSIPFDININNNGLYVVSGTKARIVSDASASGQSVVKIQDSGTPYATPLPTINRVMQNFPITIGMVYVIDQRVKLTGDTNQINARWWYNTTGGTTFHAGFEYTGIDGNPATGTTHGKFFFVNSTIDYAYQTDAWYTFRVAVDNSNNSADVYIKKDGENFVKFLSGVSVGGNLNQACPSFIGYAYSNPGTNVDSGLFIDDISIYSYNINSLAISPAAVQNTPFRLPVGATQQYSLAINTSNNSNAPDLKSYFPVRWNVNSTYASFDNVTKILTANKSAVTTVVTQLGSPTKNDYVLDTSYLDIYDPTLKFNASYYYGSIPATKFLDGTIKVDVTITNDTIVSYGDTNVISALFGAEGSLLGVSISRFVLGANSVATANNTITTTADLADGSRIKTYLWQEGTLMPIAKDIAFGPFTTVTE